MRTGTFTPSLSVLREGAHLYRYYGCRESSHADEKNNNERMAAKETVACTGSCAVRSSQNRARTPQRGQRRRHPVIAPGRDDNGKGSACHEGRTWRVTSAPAARLLRAIARCRKRSNLHRIYLSTVNRLCKPCPRVLIIYKGSGRLWITQRSPYRGSAFQFADTTLRRPKTPD